MSELVSFNCKFSEEGSQLPSALNTPTTVGAQMMLACEGAAPPFDVSKLKLEAVNQEEHTVKLLKYEPKGETTFVTFTSYRVGEHQNVQLFLSDGKESARTNPVSWTVETVIDRNNEKGNEPFGPFGPWAISWPWWYFLIVAILLAAAVFAAIRTWKASKRKLEIRKRISEYRQKFIPFDQFQKTLRRLDRENQRTQNAAPEKIFEELRQASLTYLMMEFEIDLEKRSPGWIVRKLRRKSVKTKESTFNDLALFLTEFQKKGSHDKEIEKLIEWAGRISERVDRESFGIK